MSTRKNKTLLQIAFSLFESGANIYGPFETGFQAGIACGADNDTGDHVAGSDVTTWIYELDYECSEGVDLPWFDDACG